MTRQKTKSAKDRNGKTVDMMMVATLLYRQLRVLVVRQQWKFLLIVSCVLIVVGEVDRGVWNFRACE